MDKTRKPIDQDLFARTAPQWNCIDYPDGMHYTPGRQCLWCGKTREQIAHDDMVRVMREGNGA